jgi:hypothetical protein
MFSGKGQSSIDNVAPRRFPCDTLEGPQKVIAAHSYIACENAYRQRFREPAFDDPESLRNALLIAGTVILEARIGVAQAESGRRYAQGKLFAVARVFAVRQNRDFSKQWSERPHRGYAMSRKALRSHGANLVREFLDPGIVKIKGNATIPRTMFVRTAEVCVLLSEKQ